MLPKVSADELFMHYCQNVSLASLGFATKPLTGNLYLDQLICQTAKKSYKYPSHVAQLCYSVIGDKPFLWSKPKLDPP